MGWRERRTRPRAHTSQDITRWQDGILPLPTKVLMLLVTSANCSFAILYKIYFRTSLKSLRLRKLLDLFALAY